MRATRKIDLMHKHFGRCQGHTCGECSNLQEHLWDKVYRKCAVYGISASEATDWAKRWEACGMFCKEYHGGPIVRLVGRGAGGKRVKEPEQPIDGQIGMEVDVNADDA